MIIVDCLQRSNEWLAGRRGIPTASQFKLFVTSKGEKASSAQRAGYRNALVAERLTGLTAGEGYVSDAMLRGINLEPAAREWYSFMTDEPVTQVGFIYKDKAKDCGCSPDGITTLGGIEIKCLEQKGHVGALLRGRPPSDHLVQIQASMWITQRSTWDFVLYTDAPGLPSAIWPVHADENLHAAFDVLVPEFIGEVDAAEKRLKEML